MTNIKQAIGTMAWMMAVAGATACAVEPDQAVSEDSVEQQATGFFVEGKWRRLTDSFGEACGAGTLQFGTTVATGVHHTANDGHSYSVINIPRSSTTSVFPAHAVNGNGTIPWFCGSSSEWSECSGPEDVLRVFWSNTSRAITVQCFATCGDGSSSSDCAGL